MIFQMDEKSAIMLGKMKKIGYMRIRGGETNGQQFKGGTC